MCKKIILVCFVISLISSPIYAAPIINSVSDSFTHGSAVTISGSNFGTKSPAKPALWANFESGTITANSTNSQYPNTLQTSNMSITTLDQDTHSKYSVRGNVYPGNAFVGCDWYANSPPGTQTPVMYIFNRRRYHGTGFWGDTSNFKFQRHHPSGTSGVVNFDLVYDPKAVQYCWAWEDVRMLGYFYNHLPPTNRWFIEELQINASNGTWKYWENGVLLADRNDGVSTTFGNIKLEGQSANGATSNPSWMYIDDVYIDTAWARVMIGNSATWMSCTHKEIQIPSAWSSTSVTVTVNQGTFASGTTAYLFVVDANGNVNNPGYPVTIGAGGQTPSAPVGLRIVQ